MTTVHDFEATTADGRHVPLAGYAGKMLLIVNTASRCGLTPQYEGLEALHRSLAERGLRVLGFPCNQFGGQEPGTDEQIQDFCRLTYDVTFPVFARIEVNGPGASALYQFLRQQQPGEAGADELRWNFTKFLVDREGHVVKRYEPAVTPSEIAGELERYL